MQQDPSIPQQLGRYELVRVLGRGGMGVVYEAVMHGLAGFRKRVALKVLADELHLQDAEARAALQREARLGALLSHPNLVSILDLGHTGDQWYIAMELVDGVPVSALVRGEPLTASMVLDVGIMACAGLGHIHGMRVDGAPGGLVHRDVKPQNLLVDVTGTAKLADFGVVALVSDRGGSRTAGTPTWMSPEQLLGAVDRRSDLFSLGAVLYALATRRAPFGTGDKAVERVQRADDIVLRPAFTDLVDQRIPGLGEVLRRCLRLYPADRWQDAASLGASLRALRSAHGAPVLGEAVAACIGSEQSTTAPASSASRSRPRLPEVDPLFVGRQADADRVLQACAHHRLVTITGPGGVGKTRLLLQAAAMLATHPSTGVVFADLSGATTASEVARTVGERLGLGRLDQDEAGQIAAALEARGRTFVLLDGVEGVARPCAELVDRWLGAAPELRVVATSRVPLRSRHEHVVQLAPLDPDAAVELFVARSGQPLEGAERDAARRLVKALDGLPLAIELAAARSRSMTPSMLLARLSERFRLLAGPSRSGGRHATLKASIQVSWELLRPWEQAALAQLSTFAGGFVLEAAEAVLDLSAWPEAPWAVDVLSELVDASLVAFDATRQRFSLSHSVREFAIEAAQPALIDAAELRHGDWYAQLGAEEHLERANGHGGAAIRQALVAERDNVATACERALQRGDVVVAEGTARAAAEVFRDLGPPGPGEELLTRVLALPGLADPAPLYAARAALRSTLGRGAEARADLERTLAEARRTHNVRYDLAARTLLLRDRTDVDASIAELAAIAEEARQMGEVRAEARARSIRGLLLEDADAVASSAEQHRAFELFEQEGDERGAALAMLRLGRLDIAARRHDEALRRLSEAERRFRNVRDKHNAHITRENIAVVHYHDGRRAEARRLLEELVESTRRSGYRQNEANLLSNLSVLDRHDGRIREAWASAERALVIHRSANDRLAEARTLANMASLAEIEGDRTRALGLRATTRDALLAASRPAEAAWHEAMSVWLTRGTPAAPFATAETCAEIARILPSLQGERAMDGSQLLAEAWLEAREFDRADEELRRVRSAMRTRDVMRSAELDLLEARVLAGRGSTVEAARRMEFVDATSLGEVGRAYLWMARAEVAPDPDAAGRALDQAASHLALAGAGADSEPGRRLAALRAGVDATEGRG